MFQADSNVRSLRDRTTVRAVIFTLWPCSSYTSLGFRRCVHHRTADDSLHLKTIEALSKMSNVTEFRVRPRDIGSLEHHLSPYFTPDRPKTFLQKPAEVQFGRQSVKHGIARICNLEELDLELRFPDDGTAYTPQIDLTTAVAPFISRLNPSPRSLWITTPLDLDDPSFDLLGSFPKFHNIDVSVGISRSSTSDSPITRFANRHADTLRSLVFVSDYSTVQRDIERSVSNIFQFHSLACEASL